MPFTNHVGVVAQLLEMLRQKCQVGEEAPGFLRPENSMLTSSVYGIPASHQGGPGGGADGLDIALLQPHPGHGQLLQVGGDHVAVVPGDVIVAEVIRHYHYDVWSFTFQTTHYENTTEQLLLRLALLRS